MVFCAGDTGLMPFGPLSAETVEKSARLFRGEEEEL